MGSSSAQKATYLKKINSAENEEIRLTILLLLDKFYGAVAQKDLPDVA